MTSFSLCQMRDDREDHGEEESEQHDDAYGEDEAIAALAHLHPPADCLRRPAALDVPIPSVGTASCPAVQVPVNARATAMSLQLPPIGAVPVRRVERWVVERGNRG